MRCTSFDSTSTQPHGLWLAAGARRSLAATVPLWGESSWMREFVEIACYFVFALMWNLLAGYGGMVSIGQQAFFGLGGYAMLALGNFAGVNPFVAVPLAALAAGAVALPVSWVAFRLQGGYFAIGTWVIAEVFRLTFANVSAVGGGSGTTLTALRGIDRATRESIDLLDGARLRRRRDCAGLPLPAQQARTRVARDSGQPRGRGVAGRRGDAHEAGRLRRRRRGRRARGRTLLRRQPSHLARTPRSASTGRPSRSSWW